MSKELGSSSISCKLQFHAAESCVGSEHRHAITHIVESDAQLGLTLA